MVVLLTLVLADAELELVPPKIAGHPALRSAARKRGRPGTSLMLDSSVHHAALRKLPDGPRRGRPDIVHLFLLLCLDSIPNLEGQLRTVVHMRHDRVLHVDPSARLPRNYMRFLGLIEDVFEKGAVPEDRPLLHIENGSLADVLGSLEGRRVALVEGTPPTDLLPFFHRHPGDVVCVSAASPMVRSEAPYPRSSTRRFPSTRSH